MGGIGSVELLALAVIAVLALGLAARRAARAPHGTSNGATDGVAGGIAGGATGKASGVVRTTWWVCLIYGGVVVLGTLLGVLGVLGGDTVTVDAQIEEYWPELPAGMEVDDGPGPGNLVQGSMTSATLEVAGVETSTRVLLAAGEAVSGLTIVAVVVVIALACRNIGRGTPFAPVLTRSCGLAAGMVAAGSMLGQLLTGIGANRAAEVALAWSSASWSCRGKGCADVSPDRYLPTSVWSLHFDLWPLAVALVLGVAAVLLRSGTALQRETDGLV
ncbi:hypothetical protein [Nocardioides daejeonensis]|uniref:hypothetical protein n=1 Tax=Nocardioides daejeonensis TaxID=1046556 RepID=UPI000D74285F|nr:hypothetical protein [Nocardioides daejeonensis]